MNGRTAGSLRILGAAVGALVPAAVAASAALLAGPEALAEGRVPGLLWLVTITAACGVPVGALLGALAGPSVVRTSSTGEAIAMAFGIAFPAVAIGAVEVAAILVAGDWPSGGGTEPGVMLPFGIFGLALLGIVFLGVPALLIVVPITIAWSVVVRAVGRDARSRS